MTQLPITPSFKLTGKRALVTGASSGIGLGAASALAEAGAHVVVAARTASNVASVVQSLVDAGYSASGLPLDISDVAATKLAIAAADPFDVLVNSAGSARHSAAIETTEADFDFVANINIKAAYFVTQAVASRLVKENRPGSLINISSQMAHVGGIDRAVYCATKHAVEGFTKSMAIELGPKQIRVNTICPTFIRTPLTEPTFSDSERVEWIKQKIKLQRVGEIEDIMGAVVFLASNASALVTGTSLLIDGGWTAG